MTNPIKLKRRSLKEAKAYFDGYEAAIKAMRRSLLDQCRSTAGLSSGGAVAPYDIRETAKGKLKIIRLARQGKLT